MQYLSRLADEYGLTNETSWRAWRVSHYEQFNEWQSVADVHINFHSAKRKIVEVGDPKPSDLRAKKKMELPVTGSPVPGTVGASDLLLGISTTYERIVANDYAKVKAWARFLTNGRGQTNGASLIIMLDQTSMEDVAKIDSNLQARGIDAYVTSTEQPMSIARRYYELAGILKTFGANLAANGQEKRWFGLIEDTIFFPNLSYLLDRLFSYNTDSQLYIGIPSEQEDWEMDDNSITTAGGGAVFVTRSVISRIPQLPCFKGEQSDRPIRGKYWDTLLQDCIKEHSNMKMHALPGFYSPNEDLGIPKTESYEAGLQPLIMQRPLERHSVDVNMAHLVTNICGEGCFMQRYLFHDNWVLVNGVSITEYPDGLKYQTLNPETKRQMGPITPLVTPRHILIDEDLAIRAVLTAKGRQNVWKLLDSRVGKDKSVWQAYRRSGVKDAASQADRIDSLIVLIWEEQSLHAR